jgi:hypothetical protein
MLVSAEVGCASGHAEQDRDTNVLIMPGLLCVSILVFLLSYIFYDGDCRIKPFSGIYPKMDLPSLISGSCFVEGSFTHPSCDGSASASLSTGVSPFPRNSR